MEQFGYFGVAFLITIENLFPPIPSEVILTFGGFMTTTTELNIPLMIVAATIGAVLGEDFVSASPKSGPPLTDVISRQR